MNLNKLTLPHHNPYWVQPVSYKTAKSELMTYLNTGEHSRDSTSRYPSFIIERNWLRFLLLRAGYTELAEEKYWWGISAPVKAGKNIGLYQSTKANDSTNDLFLVPRDDNNRYQLKKLGFYYPGELIKILTDFLPDYPEGQDSRRNEALADFKRAQEINLWLNTIKVPNLSNRSGYYLLKLSGPEARWDISENKGLILPLHQKRENPTYEWLYLPVHEAKLQIDKVLERYGYHNIIPEGGLRPAEKK